MVLHNIFGVERDIDIPTEVFATPEELTKVEAPLGEHEHGWFDSCIDGAKLHYRTFLPKSTLEKKCSAVVVFLNGVTSHSGEGFQLSDGRMTNVALLRQVFNASNVALYSFDNYGHGFSEGTRFFIPSYEENLKDYLTFIRLVDDKNNGSLPVFIMGSSYGGNLTIHASRRVQDNPSLGPKKFGGAILFCPAVIGDLPPKPVYYALRYIFAPLCPLWTPFFMPHPINPERVWKDPEVRKLRQEPRLVEMQIGGAGNPYRLGTALSLVTAMDEVVSKAIPGYKVPFFLAHGTDDFGVKIEGSEFLWRTVDTPMDDRAFYHVEGGYHDLLSMKDSQKYLEMVISWMEQQLKK
jgi:acylglycerol lipase